MKKELELFATEAVFEGHEKDVHNWCFVLRNKKKEFVWAFPGKNNLIRYRQKPYHYFQYCKDNENCRHKPPQIYIKLWKTFLNLGIGL